MGRADDLRALADEVDRHGVLVAEYEAALTAYREDMSGENRVRYKAAAEAVADDRARLREAEGRAGLSVGGDAFIVTEG